MALEYSSFRATFNRASGSNNAIVQLLSPGSFSALIPTGKNVLIKSIFTSLNTLTSTATAGAASLIQAGNYAFFIKFAVLNERNPKRIAPIEIINDNDVNFIKTGLSELILTTSHFEPNMQNLDVIGQGIELLQIGYTGQSLVNPHSIILDVAIGWENIEC
jgi:hypothetical protein